MARYTDPRTLTQYILRGLGLLFAVISAALYAPDLAAWTRTNTTADSRWIYAEVVATLAVISSLAQFWLKRFSAVTALWSGVIFLLWLVTVAVLGQVAFQGEVVEGGYSLARLKAAVVIDVVNMAIWLVSAVEFCLCCHRGRKGKKQGKIERVEQVNVVETREIRRSVDRLPAYEEVCDIEAQESTDHSLLDEKKVIKNRENEPGSSSVPAAN